MPNVSLDLVHRRLSPERLAPYLDAANGRLDHALRLYQWNSSVAAAFWVSLGHLEVLLRNALHEQMVDWSAQHYSDANWMNVWTSCR